jgi:drug/metabolite transporter (DMT)-like permease
VREKYLGRYGVQAALVGLAAIWGGTFVVVADAIKLYPMYGFLAWRFGVATVAFIALYPCVVRKLDRPNLSWGLLAGVFLSAGYIFQTWGLDGATATTPARAAFITGLYVILTPLFQAVLLRKVPRKSTLLGAAIALGGLWLLSGIGAASGGWVLGDTLVVICAVAYSVHMIVLGSTRDVHDVMALTFVQLATVTVVCTVISAVKEQPGLPTNPAVIWAIVLTGVLASALAFVIQTWAQSKLPPARVALILVMEPAFGGAIGWAVAGMWPIREVLGAAAMLSGMIVSEVVAAMAPASEGIAFGPAVEGMPAPVTETRPRGRKAAAEEGSDGG